MTNQTKIQYTPGPWGKQYIESSKFNEYWRISSCRGDIAIQFNVGIGEKENQANARLIAAAPELLEAINHAISDIDNHIAQYPSAKTLLPELRAYLAKRRDKAEGKE